ncbi:MAG: transposase, partial [Deferribacteraceae bacterium]|nr:transposase [Deferribacteraceae bacterium]
MTRERLSFKSRERGVFSYDVKSGSFSGVPVGYEEPKKVRKTKNPKRPGMIVSFGDLFLLDSYIRDIGMLHAIDATKYRNLDTLHALLSYYILSSHTNCYAQDWWELTYAKILYPKAQLSSQRISDALADIGSEDAKRGFFKEYFRFLGKTILKMTGADGDSNAGEPWEGILIDSSGLPNSLHMPLTAVNTHNGVTSNEIRLIYVVQQRTGLPLFFRYAAGKIVDVTTLASTIAELKANGINTKFAILDAGYYTGHNADALFDAKVSFITRMNSNFKTYKNIVWEHIG